ncbi:hypothetical protein AAE02nite_28830 [Adhaeribacter aerolatus]|uniref:Uncharacterized protein n=1 Tax=Adhaeribacter aerolatus TaxID=670289 RepID=A0A512AZT2_9BACT|nr:hypothetical protein [Adhaeribacter aerolatus]GEO05219.1 hypothetical protein AAE02nite_28830 [Adhaeribacter aerolatus]
MSEIKFETLVKKALDADTPGLFDKSEAVVYKEFELAEARQRAQRGQTVPGDNLHYKFEKVRLGVAIALMQVFSDMADDDESKKVLDILKRAAKGSSIAQIDAIITKEAKAFDSLYQDLFINDDGEMLLDLFQRTLHADSKSEMDGIINESLKLLDIIKE